jgi:sulfur-oxidizing protein SoxY
MNQARREALQKSSALAILGLFASAGLIPTAHAQAPAWNKGAFDAKNINDVVKALGGSGVTVSKEVLIDAPDIAENGAVVPVGVQSKIDKTDYVAILVEKNPSSLSAAFDVLPDTEANFKTRVKMGQSSNVLALVRANGKYYVATKEVKVTLGGCGG